jgi:cyclopropane fatty-acyl-phospholipid synthase-like methyltransferase
MLRQKFDHDAHARSCDPEDFWGQIRRTVQGKPVADDQIVMIVEAIVAGLALAPSDRVLDLACGNGALSQRLFNRCTGWLGIDQSEYLISVARRQFERLPHYRFQTGDACQTLVELTPTSEFTKVLCYGSYSYFTETEAALFLQLLHDKFSHVQTVFLGNLPDRERAALFYKDRMPDAAELQDHQSPIGIWRTPAEMIALAVATGWSAQVVTMPADFYAACYRYDVILRRHNPASGEH